MSRFMRVVAVVEMANVGEALARFTGLVQKIDYEVVEIVDGRSKIKGASREQQRNRKKLPVKTVRKEINGAFLNALSSPKMPAALCAQFGMTAGAVYQRLSKLRDAKKAKKLSNGTWQKVGK